MEQKSLSNIKNKQIILFVALFGILSLGLVGASTTIMLQDADTENLKDHTWEEINDWCGGDQNALRTGIDGTNYNYRVAIMWNVSQIPSGVDIQSASINFYKGTASLDEGESYDTSFYHLYASPNYNISGSEWIEGGDMSGCGNFAPTCINTTNSPISSSQMNLIAFNVTSFDSSTSEGWISINVTNELKEVFSNNWNNFSVITNNSNFVGSPSSIDKVDFYSKEYTTVGLRPYLNITYITAEGTSSPGTIVDDDAVGTLTWDDVGYVKENNGSDATVLDFSGEAQTHYLKATNFGFSIPIGATIDGIVVEIERNAPSSSDVYDYEVKIVKSDASIGTENKADTDTEWPSTEAYASYGTNNNDLWSEDWEYTDINDEDFGVVLSADVRASGLVQASVDHIKITVYYIEGEVEETKRTFFKLSGGSRLSLHGGSRLVIKI